jgi:hypothetical protein
LKEVRVIRCTIAVACVVLALVLAPLAARAADAQVENPAYKMWSQFKVGSFAELKADMEQGGMKMSMTMTRKLVELTADKAVVEATTSMDMGGMKQSPPAQKQEIPAKVDADKADIAAAMQDPSMAGGKPEVKKGEEEITVMGKAMKCQWYDVTIKQDNQTVNSKSWLNSTVPGGLVQNKMVSGPINMLMKLTAYEAK